MSAYLCGDTTILVKRTLHIIFTLWLALLLLFGTTSMEFIHEFANHKDTVDHRNAHGLVWEKAHHHCAFLSFVLLPFVNDVFRPVFQQRIFLSYQLKPVAMAERAIQRIMQLRSLRGPPVA